MKTLKKDYSPVIERLTAAGLRPTRQRVLLGSLLWGKGHRHMTAVMLHAEAKAAHIKVSLATVYNTLHQFMAARLIREIAVDAGKSYFDTNCEPHHHFLNMDDGQLYDIETSEVHISHVPQPPAGLHVAGVDVIIRVARTA